MRTPIIAANWKLNKTEAQALDFVEKFTQLSHPRTGVEVLICPPFTALSALNKALVGTNITLGGQNMYCEQEGAFTGEVSPSMLKEFCKYVILGHSERRTIFKESNHLLNKKLAAALQADLSPVFCVGENLEENKTGAAAEVISTQLRAGLVGVPVNTGSELVIAYEPIWAIGTGLSSSPESANTLIRNVIRPILAGLFGRHIADKIRVLYGGSVKASNAESFFRQEEIDGALVGGASLDPAEFNKIVQAVI